MRTALFALVTLVAAPALAGEPGPTLAPGQGAPKIEVKLLDVSGRQLSIRDVSGPKGTLVVFTCNHCPYAKAWETRLAAIGNEWKAKGFGVIAINSNDPRTKAEDGFEEMKARAAKLGLAFPYVVDDQGLAEAYGARKTPEVFLFDAKGKLAYHGAIDDNSEDASKVTRRFLEDALNALSEGRTPAVQDTKAVGCGIKFRS